MRAPLDGFDRLRLHFAAWRDFLNPIDWIAWAHGKYFVAVPWVGFLLAAVFGGLFATLLWARGVDKFVEAHPPSKVSAESQREADPPAKAPAPDPRPNEFEAYKMARTPLEAFRFD